ncbi:M56 family metallopeptidase [Neptunomonas antarctica]|nr:M56 family metallopeptidase [Neptunomonas antarctica]
MVTISELAVIGTALCLFCWASLIAFMQWRRSYKLLERLDVTSGSMLTSNVQLIETELPLAFSLGIFRPNAVLSTGLVNNLSSQQLHIVCTHEEVHAQYRDGLYKWILRFMCTFHYPNVKRAVLKEHALSLELRADQQVALSTECNVAVAEAIIKLQRLMSPIKNEGPLCQFLGSELEQRVHYLLAQVPGSSLPRHTLLLSTICFLILSICGSLPLHNTIEALITR